MSALTLLMKCRNDDHIFAHARLCAEPPFAPGGWLASVQRLAVQLRIPPWDPPPDITAAEQKRHLQKYRKDVIAPAVLANTPPAATPALPWAWLAVNAGSTFSQAAADLWLQFRILGQPYPARHCPWCQPTVPLTSTHLQMRCSTFALRCFMAGITPAEAFEYPHDASWLSAAIRTVEPIAMSHADCIASC